MRKAMLRADVAIPGKICLQKLKTNLVYDLGVKPDTTSAIPTILFGAFDRHNFGDLLFPHIVASMLQQENIVCAGLATRDLRAYGGHQVRALAELAADWGERTVNLIHVGGEILTCSAWQAAVMLLEPEEAQEMVMRLDTHPAQAREWACSSLGLSMRAPYTLCRELFPGAATVVYNAVGGVGLGLCEPLMRTEVLAKLRAADALSVRDTQTHAFIRAEGIACALVPDAAVMVEELFGAIIHQRTRQGEVARVREAFPGGYIAVQFSADFGDDATMEEIAVGLMAAAATTGFGVVFFRAGIAPWHDELETYQRVASRMHGVEACLFSDPDVWNICALIASSRAYLGSSLHGRIVAMAYALPCMNLLHPTQAKAHSKALAYAATWVGNDMLTAVPVHEIAAGLSAALATDTQQRRHTARTLASEYRRWFEKIRLMLQPGVMP